MSMHRTPLRRPRLAAALLVFAALGLAAAAPAVLAQRAQPALSADARAAGLPPQLKDVGFDQRLGERVPLDLAFRDHEGEPVRLADYFRAGKPVLLSLVYYECPMLCDLTLSGLAQSLKPLELTAGRDFELVTVSFDPGEGPAEAAGARSRYVPRYGRAEAWEGWHFLTGEPAAIDALAEAVGFRYQYDPERDEYAHAAGLVMLTPDGEVSRYFFGTDHPAKDLRLGLVETADEKIGSPIDQILLYCYHYDPALGRYSAATMNLLRAGGALTVLLLGGFVVIMLRRERRAAAAGTGPSARTA
jgi:protein SCO1/2